MLHTRNGLIIETKEILRAVTEFKALKYEQLIRLLYGREKTAAVILRNLCKQKRIYYDPASGIVADSPQSAENPNVSMIKAFWVFLEFNDKAEYYGASDYPALISFFANQEHYEIIYAAYDNEITLNFALSKSAGGKRLIIIEDRRQIKKLNAPDILCFCTVSPDGDVDFFQIE
jgi:hypothetical protein